MSYRDSRPSSISCRLAAPESWTPNPFEGRVRIDPGEVTKDKETRTYPAGTYRVNTDQPLAKLISLLLEPQSPDSLFQWGFFLDIFTRTEYAEGYVMEPLAQKMMEDDPGLAAEFRKRLGEDAEFAANPTARLEWFYAKTPYYDQRYRVYPVTRLPR